MAEVLPFDPHRARQFLKRLHGRAHLFAWRYYQWRLGKGRRPALGVYPEIRGLTEGLIKDAIDVALGRKEPLAAPASFVGWQERPGGKPPVPLFNLTASIPGHPTGSTVSGQTLARAGYALPPIPDNPADPGLIFTGDGLPNSPRPRFRHERLEPPGRFDPRSFRTVRRGRTRVIVACPAGHYHRGRCSVGTHAQAILHGNAPVKRGEYVYHRLGFGGRVVSVFPEAPRPAELVEVEVLTGKKKGQVMRAFPSELAPWPRGRDYAGNPGFVPFDTWRKKLGPVERELIQIVLAPMHAYADRITRRSSRQFDLELHGWSEWTPGTWTQFSAWLPLSAIRELTDWTSEPVAGMTDYPEMARTGDWSAVRDSSNPTIWRIFDRAVRPQLQRGGRGKPKPNPPRRLRASGGLRPLYSSGRIKGVWEGRHAQDGQEYRHRYGRGPNALYGLPDRPVRIHAPGAVLMVPRRGRLWATVS